MSPDFLVAAGGVPWWSWVILAAVVLVWPIVAWWTTEDGFLVGISLIGSAVCGILGLGFIVSTNSASLNQSETIDAFIVSVEDEYGLELGEATARSLLEDVQWETVEHQGEFIEFGDVNLSTGGGNSENITLAWDNDQFILLDSSGDPLEPVTSQAWQ